MGTAPQPGGARAEAKRTGDVGPDRDIARPNVVMQSMSSDEGDVLARRELGEDDGGRCRSKGPAWDFLFDVDLSLDGEADIVPARSLQTHS